LFSPLHHLVPSLVFSIVICSLHFSIVFYPPSHLKFCFIMLLCILFPTFLYVFCFVGLLIWNCLVHLALHNKDWSSSFTNEVCFLLLFYFVCALVLYFCLVFLFIKCWC
jgi:hypothetical protein